MKVKLYYIILSIHERVKDFVLGNKRGLNVILQQRRQHNSWLLKDVNSYKKQSHGVKVKKSTSSLLSFSCPFFLVNVLTYVVSCNS